MSYQPYVPEKTDQREFTLRAILIGLVMTVILGAANAYLGLRAGMTIAATYPAAVIGMAVLRIMKGSILEENIARTVGSIGESIAAGAIFTIPAFIISGAWSKFNTFDAYIKSVALMFVGGLLGILFVTFLRRVMVTDPDLVFPESVAAAEIHKAGQKGSQGSKFLFQAMGLGAFLYSLGVIQVFAASKDFIIKVGRIGTSFVRLGAAKDAAKIGAGGTVAVSGPGVFPAYIGVGYIIGPRLAALNFAGGVLAWGLFAPLLMFFLGPQLIGTFYGPGVAAADVNWADMVTNVWKFIIRPIAVGGMLVGAGYTLYRMRKNLGAGLKRSIGDIRKAAGQAEVVSRLEKDLNPKLVLVLMGLTFVLMVFVYNTFSKSLGSAFVAAVVMAVAGFFFAAVSGNLVGTIGSSNNPISGLTLVDADHRRPAHGRRRGDRDERRRGRPRRRRRRLRLLGRRGRDAPGPQGRAHPGRHALEDADRQHPRHPRRLPGHVFPADAPPRRLHLWQQGTAPRPRPASWPRCPRGSSAARWPGRSSSSACSWASPSSSSRSSRRCSSRSACTCRSKRPSPSSSAA